MLHDRVALSGDDVRGRDDELGRRDPARAGDAQPARRAEDADDARRRLPHAGLPQERRVGRLRRTGRADDRRERVDALDRVQQPAGRDDLVQPREHLRPLHRAAQLRLPRDVQQDGARDPYRDEPRGRAQHEPARQVERRERGEVQRAAQGAAGERADGLEEECADAGAEQRDDRRVRGRLPVGEQRRREPTADDRPDRDTCECEPTGDEALPQPEVRRERDDRESEPVDRGHPPSRLRSRKGDR